MSSSPGATASWPSRVPSARLTRAVAALLAVLAFTALGPVQAMACACGCSVFDVGGGLLPQEDDHGGRFFLEYWRADQTQNWIGNAKGPASANADKRIATDWYNVGFQYMFNRQWGVMLRVPSASRAFTTDTGAPPDGMGIQTFNSRSIGDVEMMAVYSGFFPDMSTGITFGLKLPTGMYTAAGFDRDTQIGSGSTDLILGAYHRGMITGDNSWQYFTQVRWLQPFLYSAAVNPDNGLMELYKPGNQVDGAVGVVYNKLYNVLGFDKIAPVVQLIGSVRQRDAGAASDPLNTGFDRIMISPGIEFTKVIDEANKRVVKFYIDVEIPIYYRTNAAVNADGTEGQLIAPYQIKSVASFNF